MEPPLEPLNVIVLGTGHYVTGETVLKPETRTDKDQGVIFPSLLYLRKIGLVGEISIAGQSSAKLEKIASSLEHDTLVEGVDKSFRAFAGTNSIEEALGSCSGQTAVIIALPDHLHVDAMLRCLEESLPFLIVKPAVTKLNDFYKVLSKIPDDYLALVDYHKVFDQANLIIRDTVHSGEIGDIQFVSSVMSQRESMLEIYGRWLSSDSPPNVNHYLGSHYIHLTSKLLGGVPTQVRATQQMGRASNIFGSHVADRIQSHVLWKRPDGAEAASFHSAGWIDSPFSASMTRQEIEVFGSKGSIKSDQGYRGIEVSTEVSPPSRPNPYFFGLNKSLFGAWNPTGLYGYQSITSFVSAALDQDSLTQHNWLPHLRDSEAVTAVLEAADLSLANGSSVIGLSRNEVNGRLEFS
jgi:predicted dehydrogenase